MDISAHYGKAFESLAKWRFENALSIPETQEVLNHTITRTAYRTLTTLEGGPQNVSEITTDTRAGKQVTRSGSWSESTRESDLDRLLVEIGKAAAFDEHKIIVESLVQDARPVQVHEIDAQTILHAVDEVGGNATVLLAPATETDLLIGGKLFQTNNNDIHVFAGVLYGSNVYRVTAIPDNVCIVVGKKEVGIRRTQPQIISSPDPSGRSITFFEEMICWAVDPQAIHVLSVRL